MAYTLTDGSVTVKLQVTGDATYGDVAIQSMKRSTEAITIDIPIPTSGPEVTIIIDYLGARQTIAITGKVKGTVTQIDSFINNMEGFIDSTQFDVAQTSPNGSGLRFTADRPASTAINVILKSFDWEYISGAVNLLEWAIIIQRGNT